MRATAGTEGMAMASITIRNLDDNVRKRLRTRAVENYRSMEEEARLIRDSYLHVAIDKPCRRVYAS